MPQLPDGKFLPPMEMNCAELDVPRRAAKHFDDRILTIGRICRSHAGSQRTRRLPLLRRLSSRLHHRSYFSSLNSTLPAALKTGKLTIRPYSVVHSLIFDSNTRKVSGVRVIDAKTKVTSGVQGAHFFPERLDARIHAHPAEFRDDGISQRTLQQQRRTRPQPDGSPHGRRRERHHARATKTKFHSAIAPMEFTSRVSAM